MPTYVDSGTNKEQKEWDLIVKEIIDANYFEVPEIFSLLSKENNIQKFYYINENVNIKELKYLDAMKFRTSLREIYGLDEEDGEYESLFNKDKLQIREKYSIGDTFIYNNISETICEFNEYAIKTESDKSIYYQELHPNKTTDAQKEARPEHYTGMLIYSFSAVLNVKNCHYEDGWFRILGKSFDNPYFSITGVDGELSFINDGEEKFPGYDAISLDGIEGYMVFENSFSGISGSYLPGKSLGSYLLPGEPGCPSIPKKFQHDWKEGDNAWVLHNDCWIKCVCETKESVGLILKDPDNPLYFPVNLLNQQRALYIPNN